MIYNEIELDYTIEKTAREDIKKLIVQGSAEMNAFQHAFVAGLIKKYKPLKLVEIGIAAGGTTCFLYECVKRNGYRANIFSVDKFEKYYRVPTKRTGYLIEEMARCPGYEDIVFSQKTLIGKTIPYFINDIGSDIDFLILDTTHSLPGELLDFFICLPYLKKGSVVVLHDTICNLVNYNGSFATKILFDVVKAKKIVNFSVDEEKYTRLPNIMAFEITEDTKVNAKDILSALTLNWQYGLEDDEKLKYAQLISNNYGDSFRNLFLGIATVNIRNLYLNQISNYFDDSTLIDRWIELKSPVLIYGNGMWASKFLTIAKTEDLEISGMIVSDNIDMEKEMNRELPIYKISDVPDNYKDNKIIYALDKKYKKQIERYVKSLGFEFL